MINLKNLIKELLSWFVPVSGTITTGATYIYRAGVCTVSVTATVTQDTVTLIGTCPYKPTNTIYSVTGTLVSGTTYATNSYIRVDADGKVYAYRRAGTAVNGTATYVATN